MGADREAAVRRLADRRHRAFRIYAGVLAAANTLVVAFWAVLAVSGNLAMVTVRVLPHQQPLATGFFWPIIPIAICGLLLLASWRRAYPRNGYPPDEIEREMARTKTSDVAPSPPPAKGSRPASATPWPPTAGRLTPAPHAAGSTIAARRRGCVVHVLVYLVINSVLVAGWGLSGGGFFWPVYLMTVWGVGVLVNVHLAYGPSSRRETGSVRTTRRARRLS
jgi:hypothetical protein